MLIPCDQIEDSHIQNVRRIAPSKAADDAFLATVRAHGVLEPILVRQVFKCDQNRDRYEIVFGSRRLRAAREAGLTEIPAEVREMTDQEVSAAQTIENQHRAPMHPVDQWRAARTMLDAGTPLLEAALALGFDERTTRRVDRLARLHPKIQALCETDMPPWHNLRTIASATHKQQEAALKGNVRAGQVPWWEIARACAVRRIPARQAIFDVKTSGLVFDEDLFAEPGSPDQFTTADVAGFMVKQAEAMKAQADAAVAKGQRMEIIVDGPQGFKVPRGFTPRHDHPKAKDLKAEGGPTKFVGIDGSGHLVELYGDPQKPKAAAKTEARDRAADEPPAAEKPGITKAGLAMIADAKTRALRETLRDGLATQPPERLLMLMMLAFTATNVDCWGVDELPRQWDMRQFRDLAAHMLSPEGRLLELSISDVFMHAGELLARLLSFGDQTNRTYSGTSGPAAEWIAAAIDADQVLPRFDTEAFLQHVGGDELRRMAEAEGKKSTGTVKAVRERLIGQLPDWRPAAAEFGAPAPTASVFGPVGDCEDDEDLDGPTDGQTEAFDGQTA